MCISHICVPLKKDSVIIVDLHVWQQLSNIWSELYILCAPSASQPSNLPFGFHSFFESNHRPHLPFFFQPSLQHSAVTPQTMAPPFESANIELDFPLYAIDFDTEDPNRLVVGGGGGAGRSGVGNKIVST